LPRQPSASPMTPSPLREPGARAFQPAANYVYFSLPACPTCNFQPATLPCPGLSWLNLATPINVEKLSFQARLSAVNREPKKFLTTPKCNIFPRPTPLAAAPPSLQPLTCTLYLPDPILRPLFVHGCEASLLPRSVRSVSSSASVSFLSHFENVEKHSFHPLSTACPAKEKKLFPASNSTFSPPSTHPPRRPAECQICALPGTLPRRKRPHPVCGATPSVSPRKTLIYARRAGTFSPVQAVREHLWRLGKAADILLI